MRELHGNQGLLRSPPGPRHDATGACVISWGVARDRQIRAESRRSFSRTRDSVGLRELRDFVDGGVVGAPRFGVKDKSRIAK